MPRTANPENELKAVKITKSILEDTEKALKDIPAEARKCIREGFKVTETDDDGNESERNATPDEIMAEVRKIYGRGYTLIQRHMKQHAMATE